jgi:large subunit ribosomal protein L15
MKGRNEKFRGSRTHGRGKKAGRGAGKRGGVGNAGLHKHKWIWTVKNCPDYFGRHGFKRAPELQHEKKTINVGDVQLHLSKYLESGIAVREEKKIVVDLTKTDISKLLGGGVVKIPMTIKVLETSQKAKEKVEHAGGKVEVPFKEEKEPEKKETKKK